MLSKIFGVLLGILGVTTTTVAPLTSPATEVARAEPPIVKIVEKTSTAAATSTAKTPSKKSAAKSEAKPVVKVIPPVAKVPKVSDTLRLAATSSPTIPPEPLPDFTTVNQKTRDALVNIICTSQTAGSFEPLSGSGVIIDRRGIILTNAHVAQYLLLKDYRIKNFLTCIARTGSPATPRYTLKPSYISKQWLADNYKNITSQKPMGTGENDFALLQITGRTDPDLKLPDTFPSLPLDNNEDNIKTNNQILLASYPAGFLGGIAIQRDLYAASTLINIGQRYTFKDGSLDAFSLGGSPVAQHGSSGGAAVSGSGKLLGIIVTSTDAADTSKRDLDAISIAHINRSLLAETHLTLDSLLASDMTSFEKTFDEETLPSMKKILIDELNSKSR